MDELGNEKKSSGNGNQWISRTRHDGRETAIVRNDSHSGRCMEKRRVETGERR